MQLNQNEVTIIEHPRPTLVPAREPTVLELVGQALSSGASSETLTALYDLQVRHEERKARIAFDAAMARAKGKFGPILKNREVDFTSTKGRTNYRHEDLAGVAAVVDGPLAEEGLSYFFKTSAEPNHPVVVTCVVLGHGHREETSLPAGRDESGSKNQHQALGSALTYLQRYTLKAALGVASAHDDDGRAAGAMDRNPPKDGPEAPEGDAPGTAEKISAGVADEIKGLIVRSNTSLPKFLAHFKVASVEDLVVGQVAQVNHTLNLKIQAQAAGSAETYTKATEATDYAKASKGE